MKHPLAAAAAAAQALRALLRSDPVVPYDAYGVGVLSVRPMPELS